jgi:hypothetical protein
MMPSQLNNTVGIKEMKNVLIGGVPRSGKSILANLLLRHHGFSVLRGDRIMSTLVRAHPEVNIAPKPTCHEQTVAERTPYLLALFRKLSRHDNIPYVIDSTLFSPSLLLNGERDIADFAIPVFVGYPTIDLQNKRREIHAYARTNHECLSHEVKGQELDDWIGRWIQESLDLQQQCLRHGFLFVDTSHDFQAALLTAVEDIMKRNPNQASHATSKPAPGAASSSQQG